MPTPSIWNCLISSPKQICVYFSYRSWFTRRLNNILPHNRTTNSEIDGPFYLVLMIVCITPTANNVMVMVELSGGTKEGMARIIGWQYAVAPVVLSITVMLVVRVACLW